MSVATRTVLAHAVQTSPDFSTWTTRSDVTCTEASEGAGQVVGQAALHRRLGMVREPGASGSPASQTPLTGIIGQWVRVLIRDAGGSVTIGGNPYAPIFHGLIEAEQRTDAGGGAGHQAWACSGLAAHLGRIRLANGWTVATSVSGSIVADYVLRVPTFNAPESGGRSASTYTVNGRTVYVFDFFGSTPWTAKQILENLLASHAQWDDPAGAPVGGLTWVLTAGTLLDYEPPTIDVNGLTLLDAINALISARRGLTWRVSVSGGTATITVQSIAAAAIGSLPASTTTVAPDLSGLWVEGVSLTEDQSETVDRIDVYGARPWVTCSLAFDPAGPPIEEGSLQPAWTVGQETAWASGTGTAQDAVWRSFRLGLRWDGNSYGTLGVYGLRDNLEVSGSDFTGVRMYDSAVDFPPGVHQITAELPCGVGFTSDKNGTRQAAFAAWKPSGSSTWWRLDGPGGKAVQRSLAIEEYPPTIHLGDPDARQQLANKNNLATSGVLMVTVGMREPDPLCVSWTRSSASWPRTNPRQMALQVPTAEQWVILRGTVTGVSAGALTTASSETVVRDDLPRLTAMLSYLRAYYAEPARALSWTDRGTIDFAAGSAPGTLVTTATLGTGSVTVNAIITRRTWHLDSAGYGTSYETARVVPDIEAIR